MRLTFVIAGLSGGGAERVLSVLANACADAGHEVTLVTLDPETADFYPLRRSIRRVRLAVDPGSIGLLHRVSVELRHLRGLRDVLRRSRPDGVIAFSTETNARVLLASLGLGLRVVVSERSDPASMPLGAPWATLRRLLYRLAHAVVLQTDEARDWIVRHVRVRRALVIPNPVAAPSWEMADRRALPQPAVVGMGRLRPEKGFDLLLDAFARTRTAHPDWHLAIVGDGPQRATLEAQAAALSLTAHVTFVGTLERPLATLREARLFVLPSRFEGFPNALIEAMSCGVPVVSFDCPSGPGVIIRDDVDGRLVPPQRVEALAAAMAALMGDEAARQRLGAAARAVTTRFAVERVVAQWLDAVVAPATDVRPIGAPAGAATR